MNLSLADAQGQNALSDAGGVHGMSDLARGATAGLIHHHVGMTALAAPTVNAYRRLRHGELNGYWANWGVEHRCAGNRVPRGPGSHMRIESRIGDGAANVHTLVATVLQAARLGVVDGLECPDPMTTDGFDEVNTDVHCAHSLSAASTTWKPTRPSARRSARSCAPTSCSTSAPSGTVTRLGRATTPSVTGTRSPAPSRYPNGSSSSTFPTTEALCEHIVARAARFDVLAPG